RFRINRKQVIIMFLWLLPHRLRTILLRPHTLHRRLLSVQAGSNWVLYTISFGIFSVLDTCGKIGCMSGHSKWSTIRHKKAINDAKKGKIFSKLSQLITHAARQGGGDINMNPTLRLYIDQAKDAGFPVENIQKAIDKGTGAGSAGQLTEAS